LDIKASALGTLKGAFGIFEKDLNALPAEVYTRCFGGKSRTVADIVYEVNMVNDDIGRNMRGEPMIDWPEGWITAPENLREKSEVIASFKASTAKILEMVEGYTEEDLEATVTTERGETTRFERCRFMALHVWYHSGQLNFMQTLLGDDGWNW
jgi:uncharacterized damage-inducible protein DinB